MVSIDNLGFFQRRVEGAKCDRKIVFGNSGGIHEVEVANTAIQSRIKKRQEQSLASDGDDAQPWNLNRRNGVPASAKAVEYLAEALRDYGVVGFMYDSTTPKNNISRFRERADELALELETKSEVYDLGRMYKAAPYKGI